MTGPQVPSEPVGDLVGEPAMRAEAGPDTGIAAADVPAAEPEPQAPTPSADTNYREPDPSSEQ